MTWSRRAFVLRGVAAALLASTVGACGSDAGNEPPPFVAVLSAFPAELAAVLAHVTVDEAVMVGAREFRVGTVGGTRVVAGMTGIGLLNAATTARAVLQHFPVTGVVVSGVAGTDYRIGDVAVADTWELADGSTFPTDRAWLRRARAIAAPAAVAFDRCTAVRMGDAEETVCLDFAPAVWIGGVGRSADSFGDVPFRCQPNGGDVFGCDVPLAAALFPTGAEVPAPVVVDNETAAIAREATARGLPFIAFRATSDGAGDPLGLPGYPVQFFTYYRLAADNAAVATAAFLEGLSGG